ncbi:hypothetical protein RND81_08G019800 [Saponaria officinalis]|uniref:BAH domain-containing protein n=1 Tax=Saponaria officinalis TaxID=3572 RepID=A0AAW1J1T3_SAPOF
MSVGIGESKIDERIEFRWGKKRGRGGAKKDVQFYESFEFDGVEYSLYDSVYLFKHGETDPYIGKLIKIWEQPVNDKKIKVLWFFRPSEISDHLQGVDVLENELFLGDGVGTGLTNINPLEAIAGKCNVVCVSKDSRNRQPSVEELEMADFIFYRTFDVKSLTISDKLEEKIAMVDVEMLLNKNVCGPTDLAKLDNVSAASDAAKAPISAEDALVTSNLAKLDNENVAVDAAKLDAVSDKTVLVAGVKREKILDKDTRETGDAAKTKQVLESGRKSSLKSPALKKTDLGKVGEGAVAVTTIENGKSVTVSDVKKQIVAGGNKSKDRLSNKSLPANDVRKTIDCDGTSTRKFGNASAASNKVAEPAGRAAATIKEEKLNEEAVGIRDTAPRKQKCDSLLDEKSSDKSYIASLGKAPKRPSEAAESNDTRKLSREHDGTSEGFSKKRKSANLIEHKSNDKMGKVSVKRPNDSRIEANNEVKQVTQRPPVSLLLFYVLFKNRMRIDRI